MFSVKWKSGLIEKKERWQTEFVHFTGKYFINVHIYKYVAIRVPGKLTCNHKKLENT